MRNVFTDGCEKSAVPWKIIVPALCFLAVFVTVLLGTAGIGRRTREQGRATAEEAVRRAAVQCYAIEGRYPRDAAYLEEHYGLILDTEQYSCHLKPVGDNLMPEIFVFLLDG